MLVRLDSKQASRLAILTVRESRPSMQPAIVISKDDCNGRPASWLAILMVSKLASKQTSKQAAWTDSPFSVIRLT